MDAPSTLPTFRIAPPYGNYETDQHERDVCEYAQKLIHELQAKLNILARTLVTPSSVETQELIDGIDGYCTDLYGETFGYINVKARDRMDEADESEYAAYAREHSVAWRNGR